MSPCPKCNCNVAELIGAGMRRGEPWAMYQCDHCGHQYYEGRGGHTGHRPEKVVKEVPVRCPRCASPDVKMNGSRMRGQSTRERNWVCQNCHYRFISHLPLPIAKSQDG